MKRFYILAAVLFFIPALLLAEDRSIPLNEALRLALEKNNLIRAAEYEKEAADHGVSVSRSRYLPRILLDESFSSTNSPTRAFMMKLDQARLSENDLLINNLNRPSSTNNFRTALTLEQPLVDLSIGYGSAMAERDAEGKNLSLERRREEIGYRLFSACLEAQKAEAMLEITSRAVMDAREHLRLAKVRTEAGMGLKSDELRAATFLAEREQQEITAKNKVVLAGMRLSLLTGGTGGETVRIREKIIPPQLKLSGREVLLLALKNRKELQEMAKETEKAGVAVKIAESAFFPTLYASATYEMNDRDTPFYQDNNAWVVGANLRWELFDGMRRGGERSRARARQNAAGEYLLEQEKEIAFQARESLLQREEAGKRLEVAGAAQMDAAEGVRLISKRFSNSLAAMIELLDAQTALNRARATVVENEADYAQATARVWYTAGIFLKEVMK
ncbi:MAG: TolC family protein [Deltaproteobacteria bacterium]